MTNYTEFTPVTINPIRANSLAHLIYHCENIGVMIDKIIFYQNGFTVTFRGYPHADVVIHDNSYGHESGLWESVGFPWDYDDVSVHSSYQIASMINALKYGDDWKLYENCDDEDDDSAEESFWNGR